MRKLTQLLQQKSLKIAVAESCTGGNLAAKLTKKSGASAYFEAGFITYSNQAKITTLGVRRATLDEFGAVSEQVAMQMVRGVMQHSSADIAVAITGIAGPTGGTHEKPVGTVCFGFCILGKNIATTQQFSGNRASVIQKSVVFAVSFLEMQL